MTHCVHVMDATFQSNIRASASWEIRLHIFGMQNFPDMKNHSLRISPRRASSTLMAPFNIRQVPMFINIKLINC